MSDNPTQHAEDVRPYRLRMRLENPTLHGKTCRVWINDVEVTGRVVAVESSWDCQDANRATISLLVDELVIDGEVLATFKVRHSDGAPMEDYVKHRRAARWMAAQRDEM